MLLVEITCLAIIYTLLTKEPKELSLIKIIPLLVFIVLFTYTIIQLLLVVQPLSRKAKKEKDESLINAENKKWIRNSSIYYQGIVAQIESALEEEKIPSEEFLNNISVEHLTKDLVQQIFILAQYSNYKRKKLEVAIIWIILTTIIGTATAFWLIIA